MSRTPGSTRPLRVRWLGRVSYREALAVQQALFDHGHEQHLLLLEHDHVFTYGQHADLATNLRCDPSAVGADFVAVNRGGDITYHGPGQLVGYPILSTDAITRKPVVVATTDGGEAIAIHPVGNLAMAWDHRAFDGAYAAGFLKKVKQILETRDWSAEL